MRFRTCLLHDLAHPHSRRCAPRPCGECCFYLVHGGKLRGRDGLQRHSHFQNPTFPSSLPAARFFTRLATLLGSPETTASTSRDTRWPRVRILVTRFSLVNLDGQTLPGAGSIHSWDGAPPGHLRVWYPKARTSNRVQQWPSRRRLRPECDHHGVPHG